MIQVVIYKKNVLAKTSIEFITSHHFDSIIILRPHL